MGFDVPKMFFKPSLTNDRPLSTSTLALLSAGLTAAVSSQTITHDLVMKTLPETLPWVAPSAFRSLFSSLPLISSVQTAMTSLRLPTSPIDASSINLPANVPAFFRHGAIGFAVTPTEFPSRRFPVGSRLDAALNEVPSVSPSRQMPAAAFSPEGEAKSELLELVTLPFAAHAFTAAPSGASEPPIQTPAVPDEASLPQLAEAPHLPLQPALARDLHVLNVLDTPTETVFLNSSQLSSLTGFVEVTGSASALRRLTGSVSYPAAALSDLAERLEVELQNAPLQPATIHAVLNKLVVLRTSLTALKPGTPVSARDTTALFSFASVSFSDADEATAFQIILNEATGSLNAMLREPAELRRTLLGGLVDLRAAPRTPADFDPEREDFADGIRRVAASSATSGDSEGDGEHGQDAPSR